MFLVLTIALCASCASKKAVQQPVQQPAQSTVADAQDEEIARLKKQIEIQKLQQQLAASAEVEKVVPCMDSSYDDEIYFRELGISTVEGGNVGSTRIAAVDNAKDLIKNRLGEFVQGVSSFYHNNYAGTKATDAVQSKTEAKLNGVVEKMLNDADKECEKHMVDAKGITTVYYVIRIAKADLKKEMLDVLSQEEKDNIDYNEYKMQKFMDEKMYDMLEAKRKAGY